MGVVYFILRPLGRSPRYRVTLDALAEHTRTAKDCITMGRLADKFKRVNDAVASFEVRTESDINGILERVGVLDAKRETVVHRHHQRIDQHHADLSEFESDLDDEERRGNGAPPDGSEDGEKPAEVTGTEPGTLAANAWTGDAYAGTRPAKT